ncbi:MAG: S1C family serine protease [Pirellulaceae bacterium]
MNDIPPPLDSGATVSASHASTAVEADGVREVRVAEHDLRIGSSEYVPPTPKDRLAWLLSASAFLLLLTFFLPYTVEKMTYAFTRGKQRAMYETAGDQLQNVGLNDLSKAYQLVAHRVEPSVVHINITSISNDAAASFEGTGWRHPSTGQGSGIIIDPAGHIVTNAHVIAGANRIEVRLSDGRSLPATIVGTDRVTDMAVLKITAGELIAAEWGDSDELEVGALVWAVGSPMGLQQSVTFGILSGKHRSFRTESNRGMMSLLGLSGGSSYHDFLQTDAAVNPGNSGGPLVDSHGRVVGVNTAIVGENYQGISLAIPSSIARPIFERIIRDGRVTRGWLGVQPRDVTVEEAKALGLAKAAGALVESIARHPDGRPSPAQLAGLQPNDVIIQWNGKPIASRTALFSQVALTDIGSPVEVVVMRDKQRITLRVTVVDRPMGMG